MDWVNSPEFFCSASNTLTDNANAYALDPTSPLLIYLSTVEAYHTSAALTVSPNQLHYIDVYMDDMLCTDQGGTAQQQRFLDLTLKSLKEISPSVPGEIKDSASLNKDLAGNGN